MSKGFNESQLRALGANGNVLVSASAGSGKTTVMIEKIFSLVKEGYEISRMAIMTFSRAASAEMKNRLIKKLYETVRRGGEEGKRALKQLEAFPFANISTIDGFCYGLMKKYYAVTGADPSAKPMDPDESDALWNECVDKACETALESESFLRFAGKYVSSRRFDNVKELIDSLNGFLAVQPDGRIFLTKDFTADRKRYFFEEYKKRITAFLTDCNASIAALHDYGMEDEENNLVALSENLKRMSGTADDMFASAEFVASYKKITAKKGRSQTGAEIYKETFGRGKKIAKDIEEYVSLAREKTDESADLQALFYVTDLAQKLYSERKKRDGKLDFNDLIRFALELLKDKNTAEEIKSSFDFIFVDEYQDTNFLQEELLNGISNGNNVYAVGDVKQAIYQFRYAEPGIFNERLRRYSTLAEGKSVYLNENYRSGKRILDFVNDVCSEIMTEGYCDIDYKGNLMTAGADYRGDSSVEIYLSAYKERPASFIGVYSVKEDCATEEEDEEGAFIASRIKSLVGKEKIYRPKSGEWKTTEYGDIAVLTRKAKDGLKVAAALERENIPYSVNDENEEAFYPRDLLVDFIRLCIGEADVPVINAISSPIFGFDAEELMEIAVRDTEISFWEAVKSYKGKESIERKAAYFIEYAEELRKKSAFLTVTDLMVKVLSDGLDGYFDSLGNGVGSRISKFLSAIRGLECNRNAGDFVTYYDRSYKGEKPPARPDSVTIMTMHKSKGLEFPIVFLPYSSDSRSENITLKSTFFADKDLGIALKYVDENKEESRDTFATKVLKLKKICDGRRELARLMYVDFTRAENRLVITGNDIKSPDNVYEINSILGFIKYASKKNPRIKTLFRELPRASTEKKTEENAEKAQVDFSYLSEKYRYEKSTVMPGKTSVSELVSAEKGAVAPYGREKSAKADLGTAYHLIMQKTNLAERELDGINSVVATLVKNGEISEEIAGEIDANKVLDLLKTDVIRLASQRKVYREQPFIIARRENDGLTLVQGVIDLIVEEEDGITVVDFKASGADRETLTERYRPQLELYAEAAEKIFGKKVKRRVLLNLLRNYQAEV